MPETEITNLLVLNHVHDSDQGVYKIIVGRKILAKPEVIQTFARDSDGEQIYDEVPLLDQNGDPVMDYSYAQSETPDENGIYLMVSTEVPQTTSVPRMEDHEVGGEELGITDDRDIIFDDDDDRWFDVVDGDRVRKPGDEVAAMQRAIVKTALEPADIVVPVDPPEVPVQATPTPPVSLPGVGEEL